MNSRNSKLALSALLLLAILRPAAAADVEIGLEAGLALTDNAFLDPAPDEVDDLVYRASPFLNVTHESPGFDAVLRYRLQWFEYEDLGTTSSYHTGQALLTGKFFEEKFTLGVGASRQQVLLDPTDTVSPGRLPETGNLIDRDELLVNPTFRTFFGSSTLLNIDVRATDSRFDDPTIQGDVSYLGNASIDNYAAGRGITFALRYQRRETDYEISPTWRYQQASAELGFWASSRFRLFVGGGEESPWDEPLNDDLEDPFWEAGFGYRVGETLTAEFAGGEREYGSSWRGNVDYQFQRGNLSFSYTEAPTTIGFGFSNAVPVITDPDDLNDFLNVPGQSEQFLSKLLRWDLNLDLRRTVLTLSFFDEERSDRILTDGTLLEDQAQLAFRASLAWDVGSRTDFRLFGTYIESETAVENFRDFYQAGISMGYQIGPRVRLSLDYNYAEQEPSGDNATGRDYTNNIVSLFVTITN